MSFLNNFIKKKLNKENTEEMVQNPERKMYITNDYSVNRITEFDRYLENFPNPTDEVKSYDTRQSYGYETISYSTSKDNLIEYCYRHLKNDTIDIIKGIQSINNRIKSTESLEEKASSSISKFLFSDRKEEFLREKKSKIKKLCERIKNLFDIKLPGELFIRMVEELESEYPDIFSDLEMDSLKH